jgi:hypothetical protein
VPDYCGTSRSDICQVYITLKISFMQPKTLLSLLFFILSLQGFAQLNPASFSMLQIKSSVYNATFNVYIYEPEKKSAGDALPVVYMPNLSEDQFSATVNNLMTKSFLPRAIIVGISQPAVAPVKFTSLVSPSSIDPKGLFNEDVFLDEEYYQFVRTEIMPGIERTFKTGPEVLCADGNVNFMNYVLNNHPTVFKAYMSCDPFVWFDGANTLVLAKTYFSAYTKERNHQTSIDDVYIPDEVVLKNSRYPNYRH